MNAPLAVLLVALFIAPSLAGAGSPGDVNDSAVVSPAIAIEISPTPDLETPAPQEGTEPVATVDPEPPTPTIPNFSIDYKVSYLAFGGTLTFNFQRSADDDTYRVSAATKARGITKLLMGNDPFEQADFSYANDRIIPLRYQLESGKKSGEDSGEITFDWETNTANSIYEGDPATLELGPDIRPA